MSIQKKIVKINKLLVERFGIPPRNKKLPDPVEMLIATILSQNTNDKNSFQAYQNLKKKFPTFEALASANRTAIENEIRIAGLGLQKSTAIKNFLNELKEKTGTLSLGFVKNLSDEEAITQLTSYKGVGVKTASCVLLFALDKNICPVDTHVFRTVNRLGLTKTSTPDKTFRELNKGFPESTAHSFHTNLIRLGREICKPKNPACGSCPLLKVCGFEDKNPDNKIELKENSFMLLDNINS